MFSVSEKSFDQIVSGAIEAVPEPYKSRLQNIAFLIENDPSPEQRVRLKLTHGQTLFGLYEGVPLPARGGAVKLLPDKITLFKNPLEMVSNNLEELKEQVAHTMWHEVAHYFGLNHQRIDELDHHRPGL